MAATSELSILLTLKDNISKSLDSVSGKLKSMEPVFKGMAVAGSAALGAVGAIAVKSLKDYAEAEKSAKQLEHATLQVAKGSREQLKILEETASMLQKKGVLDADAIKMGQAQLMTFGISADMAKKLSGSLADLAVNQFGVNASGDQLTQTANMIAKALNGQFGVLEKSGIRFTDAQKHMIQFGNETERTSALQEGFAQNLKFTNEVALGTLEGKMAHVNVMLGDVSENIGAALAPALVTLLEKVTPIIEKIVAWAAENPKLIATILGVVAGVGAIVAGLGFLGLVIPSVITGVTLLGSALMFLAANPIGIIITAIAALIAIGILVYKNWDTISAKAIEIWTAIKEFLRQTIDGIGIIFQEKIDAIKNFFREGWDGVKIITEGVWTGIKNFFAEIWEGIKGIFDRAINWIMDKIRPVLNAIDRIQSFASSGASLNPFSSSFKLPGFRASGGPVSAGSPYIVGEQGPELFVPSSLGSIVPNNRLTGAGAISITITGNTFISERDLARKVGNELVDLLKLNKRL